MPVLGPQLFLQDLQGPWCCSLSSGGGCAVVQLIFGGQVGVWLQPGNVLREAVLRDPEVSLVTGTTCSRQHRTLKAPVIPCQSSVLPGSSA